jgi:hypothetical protein
MLRKLARLEPFALALLALAALLAFIQVGPTLRLP